MCACVCMCAFKCVVDETERGFQCGGGLREECFSLSVSAPRAAPRCCRREAGRQGRGADTLRRQEVAEAVM